MAATTDFECQRPRTDRAVQSIGAACLVGFLSFLGASPAAAVELRAGAATVDVTPVELPVLVNGGMLSRRLDKVKTRLKARALVLDDGRERLAIVVVDSCMMPRPLLDEAKELAARRSGIRRDRMLVSATHTHSAPASMGCLGTDADPKYAPYLRQRIAEAIVAAAGNLEPARVGWAVKNAAGFTAVRRWIRRPDRIDEDPFGNRTVRANMHAARKLDDVVGESGPEDPDLSLISFESAAGRPLCVLANFSMHYYSGEQGLSADYFGLFCEGLEARIGNGGSDGAEPPFVAILSHGCSGDIWRRDYRRPSADVDLTIETYAKGLVEIALAAHETIDHDDGADLAMAERRMTLRYRVPDKQRLEWARRVVEGMGDREPRTTTEVYAREQVILAERQSTEIVVQALRLGAIAIATTPTETYALTGMKIKLQSPLARTMVIELANGGDGYIPPPEQHLLGGYNTWAARSAGLEVEAEPKITAVALGLLEDVTGNLRREFRQSRGPAALALLDQRPLAYWRLDEFSAPRAVDSSGQRRDAIYEPGVVFFLEGPRPDAFCVGNETNRAAHFAGGRLRSRLDGIGDRYSVSLWFWNGMPVDARETTGWMFSRGRDHAPATRGDHVGLGGAASRPGRLIFHGGPQSGAKPAVGRTAIERWTWNHLVFVRAGRQVRVHLNGEPRAEIEAVAPAPPPALDAFFFGGRSDNDSGWEGRLDEIAVFDRALSPEEIGKLAAR